jgi:hypothetical protein
MRSQVGRGTAAEKTDAKLKDRNPDESIARWKAKSLPSIETRRTGNASLASNDTAIRRRYPLSVHACMLGIPGGVRASRVSDTARSKLHASISALLIRILRKVSGDSRECILFFVL